MSCIIVQYEMQKLKRKNSFQMIINYNIPTVCISEVPNPFWVT